MPIICVHKGGLCSFTLHTVCEVPHVFFVSYGFETFSGASFGSQWCRKTTFENISGSPFWDPGPSDPKGVPRDRYFWHKNFLISSSCDLIILCIFVTGFAKNATKCKNVVIFIIFPHNRAKMMFLGFFSLFCKTNPENT